MARELYIAGRRIADDEPAWVCAELGNNHGGDLPTAKLMIRKAAEAGASAVKFQKRDNAHLYTAALLAKSYEHEDSYGPTYGLHREALEFTPQQIQKCQRMAQDRGLACFSTAFDERSADALYHIGCRCFKVHSGGLTDGPLLHHLAAFGVPVLVSTGGGELEDIDRAHEMLGACPHAFLHCTASYPLKAAEANLRCILTLGKRYPDTVIGFSSHHPGIALSLIAYAFGARIIEHHFTLSRASKGTDHGFSLEPKGLQTLVEDLETVRQALGDGVKKFYPSEVAPIAKMRRVQTDEGWKIAG